MQATSTPTPTSPPTPEGNATTPESTSTAKADGTPVVWPRDLAESFAQHTDTRGCAHLAV